MIGCKRLGFTLFVALILIAGLPTPAFDQTASAANRRTIAIRAGKLFDSNSGKMLMHQLILVQDDRISDVGSEDIVKIPAGAQMIDLSQRTVLPGLIDAHTHIFDTLSAGERVNTSSEAWTLSALHNAQTDLNAGFTTLRDVYTHGEGYGDVAVREAIDHGDFEGPRMQVSTKGIGTGPKFLGFPGITVPSNTQNINGVDEARAAVREQVGYGADWIKVIASGAYSFSANGELYVEPKFTLAELQAIVDEAHRHHHGVACHAFGGEALADCIEAGVNTVEHGQGLNDALITKMLQKGIYYVPTMYRYSLPEILESDRKATGGKYNLPALHDKAFRLALSRGVKICFGSGVDGSPYAHGKNALEFDALVKHGMEPAAAIQSATKVDSEMMGLQNQIGSVEKGKYADIIGVSGDPLKDITELQRVKFVMKGGAIVRNSPEDTQN
jgi:imidazolonepropionase-like amidohydrolase